MTERTVLVRLKATATDFNRTMAGARASVQGLTKDIDTSSDRTAWMAQSLLAIGPAVAPIGAAAVPIIAGLATQLGIAAVAGGTLALAFNGIGEAVKAVNDFELEPTVENLEKMNVAMEKIGPAGREFVTFLDQMGEQLSVLSDDARAGMFPGMQAGLEALMSRLPELRNIVTGVAEAIGKLSREAGQGLSGEGFDAFFNYLETDAKPILVDMGRTLGNFVEGIANLVVQFGPLTDSFSGGFLEISRSFSEWSRNLDENESFQDFLAYAEESLPKVGQLIGSLADFFVALVRAAAPVGDILLPALSGVIELMSKFLDTPLGPVFIALGAAVGIYGRAAALARITTGGLGADFIKAAVNAKGFQAAMAPTVPTMRGLARAAGPAAVNMGLIGLSMTGLPEKFGLTNTAMGAMLGMLGGPWGIAIGAGVGLLFDWAAANETSTVAAEDLVDAINRQTGAFEEAAFVKVAESLSQYSDTARAAGISLAELTQASIFGGIALENVQGRLDTYIASLGPISGGNYDAAAAAGELSGALNGQNDEVNKATELAHIREAATDAAAAADGRGAGAAERHARAVERLVGAVAALNDMLDARANARAYEAALDDLTDSVKKNGQAWSKEGPKGRENLERLDAVAKAAGAEMERLTEKGRNAAAQRVATTAIADLKALSANWSPAAKAEVQQLINKLKETDQQRAKPKVDLDKSAFDAQANAVDRRLNALNGARATTYIDTIITTTRRNKVENQLEKATGGYIRGPGSTTSDSIPAWLSDKEYVVNAAAVAKYGVAMFDRINAQRFATGGPVRNPWSSPQPTPPPEWRENIRTREEEREAIKKAIEKFTLDIDATVREFTVAFDRLQRRITEAGGKWTTALVRDAATVERLAKRYQRLENRLEVQQEKLAEINAAYDEITSQRTGLESDVAGAFHTSVTGGGLAGLDKALSGDIANRQAMDAALATLRAMGLDVTGDRAGLYNELVRSGDIKTAQQLIASGASGVDFYEGQYAQRDALNAQSAAAQGELAFGEMQTALHQDALDQQARIDKTTDAIHETKQDLRQELRDMRIELQGIVPKKIGKEVGDQVNGAVVAGHQQGQAGGPGGWGGGFR